MLERAVGICHEADLPAYFPQIAAALGAAYTLSGRVTDAVPLLLRALEQHVAAVSFQALCSLSLKEAQMWAGHLEEAQALARGLCRKVGFWRENPKIGSRKINGLRVSTFLFSVVCDRAIRTAHST